MARKVSITKDMILEAALRMLIRDGYPVDKHQDPCRRSKMFHTTDSMAL